MSLATRLQQLPVSKQGHANEFGSATTSSCKGECCWAQSQGSQRISGLQRPRHAKESVAGHEATAAPCIKARDRKRFRVCNDLVMQRRALLATRLQQLPVSKQGLKKCRWPRGHSSSLYQSQGS